MTRHLIEETPDVRLAHFTGADTATFALSTQTTYRYQTYPIEIRRPAEGRVRRGVYCGTCRQSVEVIVPSARLTLRTQRYWLALTAGWLGVFVAVGVYLGIASHGKIFHFGFFALLILALMLISAPLVKSLDKAQTAHGVAVARKQPPGTRRHHSIRRVATPASTRAGRQVASPTTPRTSRPAQRKPVSYTGPDRANSTEHPVFGLRAGMDRATVAERLGPPTRSTTGGEVLVGYSNVVGDTSRLAAREFWTYEGSLPDHDINIALADGVIDTVEITRYGTGDPKSSSGKGRIRISRGGIEASTPGHTFLMLSTMLREVPAIDAARLQAEYESVQQSWTEAPGKTGSALVISNLLVDDLNGDAALPGLSCFALETLPEMACVQVLSIIDLPGERLGRAIAYRVWRIDGGKEWALVRSQPRG